MNPVQPTYICIISHFETYIEDCFHNPNFHFHVICRVMVVAVNSNKHMTEFYAN